MSFLLSFHPTPLMGGVREGEIICNLTLSPPPRPSPLREGAEYCSKKKDIKDNGRRERKKQILTCAKKLFASKGITRRRFQIYSRLQEWRAEPYTSILKTRTIYSPLFLRIFLQSGKRFCLKFLTTIPRSIKAE